MIPTYNERENIGSYSSTSKSADEPPPLRGIIVDDDSPDGSGKQLSLISKSRAHRSSGRHERPIPDVKEIPYTFVEREWSRSKLAPPVSGVQHTPSPGYRGDGELKRF